MQACGNLPNVGGCAATLGGDNNHIFADFWITACRPTTKFWWGHHGTCAHHSNCPPPPSGVGSDSDHFTPAQPPPRVEPKIFSTWHNHHWSKPEQLFFQVLWSFKIWEQRERCSRRYCFVFFCWPHHQVELRHFAHNFFECRPSPSSPICMTFHHGICTHPFARVYVSFPYFAVFMQSIFVVFSQIVNKCFFASTFCRFVSPEPCFAKIVALVASKFRALNPSTVFFF